MKRRWAVCALGCALATAAVDARALPKVGASAPNAVAEDADGKTIDVRALRGKPVLVVYEDKDSATLNQALKDALSKLAIGDKYRLVPVADVSGYDFWPVKGFVRDAIRGTSRDLRTTVYCDFSGAFRTALGLERGTSNVVLLDKRGKVLFARAGALSDAERTRVIDLLQNEVGD